MRKIKLMSVALALATLTTTLFAQSPNSSSSLIRTDISSLQSRSEKGAAGGYAPLSSGTMVPPQYLFPGFLTAADSSLWVKSGNTMVALPGFQIDSQKFQVNGIAIGEVSSGIFGIHAVGTGTPLVLQAGAGNNHIFIENGETLGGASLDHGGFTWSIGPDGGFNLGGGAFNGAIDLSGNGISGVSILSGSNVSLDFRSGTITSTGNLTVSTIGTNTGLAVSSAGAAARPTLALNTTAADLMYGRLSGTNTWNGANVFGSAPFVPDGSFSIPKIIGLQGALDAKVSATGGTITGSVSFAGSGRISNLLNPINPQDALTLSYADGRYVVNSSAGLPVANTASVSNPSYALNVTSANLLYGSLASSNVWSGINSFSLAPIVPDSSFSIAKVTNLQSALDSKLSSSGGTVAGDLSMGTHKVTSNATPTASADLVSLGYLQANYSTLGATGLPLTGGTLSGNLNMGAYKITNLANPSASGDAVSLAYLQANYTTGGVVDPKLSLSGGIMAGNINMAGSYRIQNLPDPSGSGEPVTKSYAAANYLTSTGDHTWTGQQTFANSPIVPDGSFSISKVNGLQDQLNLKMTSNGAIPMIANLQMGGNKITGLNQSPTAVGDAVSLGYLQTNYLTISSQSSALPLSGGVLSGPLSTGTNKITTSAVPAAANDVVNLNYLNSVISSGASLPLVGGTLTGVLKMGTAVIDMNSHKITNMADPTVSADAVTLSYLQSKYVPSTGGAMTGALTMGANKVTSTATPSDASDLVNLSYLQTNYMTVGSVLSGNVSLSGSYRITNMADPVNAQDAATKAWVGAGGGGTILSIAGGTLTGNLAMTSHRITGLPENTDNYGTYDYDAVPKHYVDTYMVAKNGNTVMTGDLQLGSHKISNVRDPDYAQDAATKNYVDNNALSKGGGTMLANFSMGNYRIMYLLDPQLAQDAATKNYVDSNTLFKSGGTMTGQLRLTNADMDMGSHKITNLLDPYYGTDAATKNYVDNNNFLQNGSRQMTGNMQMGNGTTNYRIVYMADPVAASDAVSLNYLQNNYATRSGLLWSQYGSQGVSFSAADPSGASTTSYSPAAGVIKAAGIIKMRVIGSVTWTATTGTFVTNFYFGGSNVIAVTGTNAAGAAGTGQFTMECVGSLNTTNSVCRATVVGSSSPANIVPSVSAIGSAGASISPTGSFYVNVVPVSGVTVTLDHVILEVQ